MATLLEHANIRVPRRLDSALSLVTTWPNMHKIHHSRDMRETDSNYGNIFSWFDRLFGTYTPSWRGTTVACGLDGFDDPSVQTTSGLLVMPFRNPQTPRRDEEAYREAKNEAVPAGCSVDAGGMRIRPITALATNHVDHGTYAP